MYVLPNNRIGKFPKWSKHLRSHPTPLPRIDQDQRVPEVWFIIAQTLGIHFSLAVPHVNFVAKDHSETSFLVFFLNMVWKIRSTIEFSQEFWTKIYVNTFETLLYWASIDLYVDKLWELIQSETRVQVEG